MGMTEIHFFLIITPPYPYEYCYHKDNMYEGFNSIGMGMNHQARHLYLYEYQPGICIGIGKVAGLEH